jgi:hypothetical protein
MFEYFYHEILRRTIIAFGSLFNEITIKRKNDSDNVFSVVKVPLAYGPTQKFLARLEQSPDLNKPVQITLPRMSFEFIGLNYDPTRKVSQTQSFLSTLVDDNKQVRKTYLPVPYNMDFELSVMTKLNDDMLQIVEQILPYFQPAYTVSVNLVDTIGEKRDIPIVLENIGMQDDYEGNFDTRRALIYTFRFTAKTYLFGPVTGADVSGEIIKKVSLGFVAGDTKGANRDLTYSSEPKAVKNYTGNSITRLAKDVETEDSKILVESTIGLQVNQLIDINGETLQIKAVNDYNKEVTVTRSLYNTSLLEHVQGSQIYIIDSQDDALIEPGDDFGFTGSLF